MVRYSFTNRLHHYRGTHSFMTDQTILVVYTVSRPTRSCFWYAQSYDGPYHTRTYSSTTDQVVLLVRYSFTTDQTMLVVRTAEEKLLLILYYREASGVCSPSTARPSKHCQIVFFCTTAASQNKYKIKSFRQSTKNLTLTTEYSFVFF